jgi:hypothetical protein
VARDVLREADELERRLAVLGLSLGPASAEPDPAALPRGAAPADEVAAAIERVRWLVDAVAEVQGRLQTLRSLKERLDRPRPPRTPER